VGKPLLVDLSFYRIGKFKKIEKSEGIKGNLVNIVYYPAGWKSIFGITNTIRDVHPDALIGPIANFDPRVPWEDGIYFLLSGENGISPGSEKLDRLRDRVISKLAASKEDSEIASSLDKTRAELADRDRKKRDKDKEKDFRRSRFGDDDLIY